MKNMKTFDLFQKVNIDNIAKPTIIGALISMCAICLIIFLIIQEFINYLTPTIKKDSIILNDKLSENLNIMFSLKLHNVPCALISIDREDLLGSHQMDIRENIQKIRLNLNNETIQGNYIPYKTELLTNSIKEKESCFIYGQIPVRKAPGDIHFSFHPYREVWEYLKNEENFIHQISINHNFINLNFGEKNINQNILKRFGYNENTKMLFNDDNFPNFIDEIKSGKIYNYNYYIKLIPHLFKDEIYDTEYLAYQYSISYKSKEINLDEEMPMLLVNYDFSPISMKITLQKEKFTHFLIHICAIVGGVFVIFSIINKIILSLYDDLDYLEKSN